MIPSLPRGPLERYAVAGYVPAFFVFIRRIFKGSERQRKMHAHEMGGAAPAANVAAKE
jgi:hypothetical protein